MASRYTILQGVKKRLRTTGLVEDNLAKTIAVEIEKQTEGSIDEYPELDSACCLPYLPYLNGKKLGDDKAAVFTEITTKILEQW